MRRSPRPSGTDRRRRKRAKGFGRSAMPDQTASRGVPGERPSTAGTPVAPMHAPFRFALCCRYGRSDRTFAKSGEIRPQRAPKTVEDALPSSGNPVIHKDSEGSSIPSRSAGRRSRAAVRVVRDPRVRRSRPMPIAAPAAVPQEATGVVSRLCCFCRTLKVIEKIRRLLSSCGRRGVAPGSGKPLPTSHRPWPLGATARGGRHDRLRTGSRRPAGPGAGRCGGARRPADPSAARARSTALSTGASPGPTAPVVRGARLP